MRVSFARVLKAFLIIVACSTVDAVQLTPDTVISSGIKDRDSDRGLELASGLCAGVGASIDFDIIKLEGFYYDYKTLANRYMVDSRFEYLLAYTVTEKPFLLDAGLRGVYFAGHSSIRRNECFISFSKNLASVNSLKLIWDISADLDNGAGLYSKAALQTTFPILDDIDLDAGLFFGAGDKRFSNAHMKLISPDVAYGDAWHTAGATVSFVYMAQWFDLSPFVSYESLVGSSLRNFVSSQDARRDHFTSGLILKIYWN